MMEPLCIKKNKADVIKTTYINRNVNLSAEKDWPKKQTVAVNEKAVHHIVLKNSETIPLKKTEDLFKKRSFFKNFWHKDKKSEESKRAIVEKRIELDKLMEDLQITVNKLTDEANDDTYNFIDEEPVLTRNISVDNERRGSIGSGSMYLKGISIKNKFKDAVNSVTGNDTNTTDKYPQIRRLDGQRVYRVRHLLNLIISVNVLNFI